VSAVSTLSIVCDNCGAKYRIPEADERTQAKCQKCGSVIDVTRQRNAGDAPVAAAAKPAAARPAIDRSKEPPPAATARPTIGHRSPERPRRPERGETGERAGRGSRRTSRGDDTTKPKWPWIVGAAVVVLAGILFFVLRKGH